MNISNQFLKRFKTTGTVLEQRNRLLEVVKQTSEILLASDSDNHDESLLKAMELLARCVDADRLYIWKNEAIEGKLRYERQYEWINADLHISSPRLENAYYYIDTIPQWDKLFSAGKYVNGPLSSLSKTEQDILGPFNIRSILAIPLFLQQKFWGFVSFDDCRHDKTFSADEVSILRTGSLLLANTVARNYNRTMIETRMRQQELMAAISKSFISKEPIDNLINQALSQMGKFLETSRIVFATTDKNTAEIRIAYSWYAVKKWQPRQLDNRYILTINESFPSNIPETGYITAICCNDIKNEFNGKYHFYDNIGVKSFILAPIFVEGSFWGFISVDECEHHRSWSESDIQLVGTVSSSIAGAIARDLIDKARTDALKQAVQASMAKGNFLANMSHEMRTPMNAIIGMTSIGKNSTDTKKKDYAFEKIENASTHLLGVINDILDMSKIEANKFELSPITFNFEKMLQKVVNVISFRIDERFQEFTVQIDERIPHYIVGDDQHLAQVITNLLSNAVKFTPERGSIRLTAKLAEKEHDLYTIQIEVKDTGIGISKEQQAKLFSSFEQADSGTSRKFGGTGLGLAISKRIVELMDGRIWIESEPGEGSTFIFTIKTKKGHGVHAGMLAPGVNIRNMRILVADDNSEILEYFSEILRRLDITCDVATSGSEALELLNKNGSYDLNFIDWKMPGMDGVELTQKIKEHSKNKAVVIMISAAEWNNVEKDAKKAGVDKFLSKPLFPSTIVDVINECLGSNSLEKAPKEPVKRMDNFEGHCILLAEDVEINREIVLTLLEPTLLKIDTAENGREALEKFSAAPDKYETIFMDIQMPEMDGYEATIKIREIEKQQDAKSTQLSEHPQGIPIIAMTANVFREDVEKCLAAGMNDHVGKPLDIDEVLEKLRKYLRQKPVP